MSKIAYFLGTKYENLELIRFVEIIISQ